MQAMRSEIAVESFFQQSNGTLNQRDILEIIDFFQYDLRNKKYFSFII